MMQDLVQATDIATTEAARPRYFNYSIIVIVLLEGNWISSWNLK